jgi:capsular polysaccharide biosynthesis protein
MEFLEYLRLVRRHWFSVLALALAGLLLGGVSVLTATPSYTATADMYVGPSQTRSLDLSASQYTLDRMPTYAALVDSSKVTNGVVQKLGLDLSPEDVGSKITATVIQDTAFIRLTVDDTAPVRTARIADAAAERLGAAIVDLESSPNGTSPIKVQITRPATVPSQPTSPNTRNRVALGLVVGLGLGLLNVSMREQAGANRERSRLVPRGTDGASARVPAADLRPLGEAGRAVSGYAGERVPVVPATSSRGEELGATTRPGVGQAAPGAGSRQS